MAIPIPYKFGQPVVANSDIRNDENEKIPKGTKGMIVITDHNNIKHNIYGIRFDNGIEITEIEVSPMPWSDCSPTEG